MNHDFMWALLRVGLVAIVASNQTARGSDGDADSHISIDDRTRADIDWDELSAAYLDKDFAAFSAILRNALEKDIDLLRPYYDDKKPVHSETGERCLPALDLVLETMDKHARTVHIDLKSANIEIILDNYTDLHLDPSRRFDAEYQRDLSERFDAIFRNSIYRGSKTPILSWVIDANYRNALCSYLNKWVLKAATGGEKSRLTLIAHYFDSDFFPFWANSDFLSIILQGKNDLGQNPLLAAVARGETEGLWRVARNLLQYYNVYGQDREGRNILHLALGLPKEKANETIHSILDGNFLSAGEKIAALKQRTKSTLTPIDLAKSREFLDIRKYMRDYYNQHALAASFAFLPGTSNDDFEDADFETEEDIRDPSLARIVEGLPMLNFELNKLIDSYAFGIEPYNPASEESRRLLALIFAPMEKFKNENPRRPETYQGAFKEAFREMTHPSPIEEWQQITVRVPGAGPMRASKETIKRSTGCWGLCYRKWPAFLYREPLDVIQTVKVNVPSPLEKLKYAHWEIKASFIREVVRFVMKWHIEESRNPYRHTIEQPDDLYLWLTNCPTRNFFFQHFGSNKIEKLMQEEIRFLAKQEEAP